MSLLSGERCLHNGPPSPPSLHLKIAVARTEPEKGEGGGCAISGEITQHPFLLENKFFVVLISASVSK